jgi:hypothetical protein
MNRSRRYSLEIRERALRAGDVLCASFKPGEGERWFNALLRRESE